MPKRAEPKCSKIAGVTFHHMDLNEKLRFSGDTFSQVVSINTLYAVADPEATLREFYRVLASQGKLLLVTPVFGFENGEILRQHSRSQKPSEYWKGVHANEERESTLVHEAFNDKKLAEEMLVVARHNRAIAHNCKFHFFHEEELRRLLCKIGFKIKHVELTYADQAFFITASKP